MNVNLWTAPVNSIAITTNGIVNRNGYLAMGGGCALEARLLFPQLPARIGAKVKAEGNHVYVFDVDTTFIISFPTKDHFIDPSTIALVEQSCRELRDLVDSDSGRHLAPVAIPRPGCGLGGLDWETQVKPICQKYFDDRFIIVDFPSGVR